MARVDVYNGLSSIIPIFDSTKRDNLSIKIKEEPVELAEGTDEPSDDTATSCPSESIIENVEPTVQMEEKINYHTRRKSTRCTETVEGLSSTRSSALSKDNNDVNITSNVTTIVTDRKDSSNVRRTRGTGFSTHVECDICFRILSDNMALKRHKTMLYQKTMTCHVCRKNFTNPIQLASHRRSTHRGIDWHNFIYKCDYCKLAFTKKISVQQHIFHFHDVSEIPQSFRRRHSQTGKFIASSDKSKHSSNKRKSKKRKRDKHVNNTSSNELNAFKKQKRDNLIESVEEPLPNDDYCNDETVPSENQVTSEMSTSVEKSNTPLNSNPPLVKIFAIPNEVEDLLNDKTHSSKKRYKDSSDSDDESTDDDDDVENLNKEYCLRSGVKSAELVRYMRTPGVLGSPTRSLLRQWAIQRRRFHCHDSRVVLERIKINDEYNSSKGLSESAAAEKRPTVGVELQNLDLALQKYDNSDGNDKNNFNDKVPQKELNESIDPKNQISSESSQLEFESPKKIRGIYLSSMCRIRFTTQKKLIYHYLGYHTGPSRQECGVCRLQFSSLAELRKHLVIHCISIPKSDGEKSPIDLKGPCEVYKKKPECEGCKKKFWSISFLDDHKMKCSDYQQIETAKSVTNPQTQTISSIKVVPLQKLMPEPVLIKEEDDKDDTETREACPDNSNTTIPTTNISDKVLSTSNDCEDHNYSKQSPTSLLDDNSSNSPSSLLEINNDNPNNNNQSKNNAPSFACTVCRSRFKTHLGLTRHEAKYRAKNNDGKYESTQCKNCDTRFPTPSLYQAHARATHAPQSWSNEIYCLICNQTFAKKKSLREHTLHIHASELKELSLLQVIPPTKFAMVCSKCDAVFQNRKKFIEHCMYYYDDEIIDCPKCDEKFRGRFRAHYHVKMDHFARDQHKTYTHRCRICEEGFEYQSHLQAHIQHVHGNQSYPMRLPSTYKGTQNVDSRVIICGVCKEYFPNQKQFQLHQEEYSNTGKFQCELCNQRYSTAASLLKHFKINHSDTCDPESRKCNYCEMTVLKTDWIPHIKHYHGMRTYKSIPMNVTKNYSPMETLQHADVTSTSVTNRAPTSTNSQLITSNPTKDNSTTHQPVQHISQIEYARALCDLSYNSPDASKTHRRSQDSTVNCSGEICVYNFDAEAESNEVDIDVVGIDENTHQVPTDGNKNTDPLMPESPVQGLSVSNNENIDSNFEITNIYSVQLEEYENLQNSENNFGNKTKDTPVSSKNNDCDSRTCEVCHLTFPNRNSISKHLEEYNNTGQYACTQCERKFPNKSTYQRHVKKHKTRGSDPKDINLQYYCKECDERFAIPNTKIAHFAHIHGTLLKIREDVVSSRDSDSTLNIPSRRPSDEQRKTRQQARLETSLPMESSFTELQKLLNSDTIVEKQLRAVAENGTVHQNVMPLQIQIQCNVENDHEDVEIIETTEEDNSGSVLCDICGLVFNNNQLLINHQQSHAEAERLEGCSEKDKYLEVDLTIEDDDNDIVDIETVTYRNNADSAVGEILSAESSSKTLTNSTLPCRICNAKFSDVDSLSQHVKTHGISCNPIILRRKQKSTSRSHMTSGNVSARVRKNKDPPINDTNNPKSNTQTLSTHGTIKKSGINETSSYGSVRKTITTIDNGKINNLVFSTDMSNLLNPNLLYELIPIENIQSGKYPSNSSTNIVFPHVDQLLMNTNSKH